MTERQRRSIRLRGYDYASVGAYFVTICSHERQLLFVEPTLAQIIDEEWHSLHQRFSQINLDEFVIMPNHVHFVIWNVGAPLAGALGRGNGREDSPQTSAADGTSRAGASPAPTLGTIVGSFKSRITVRWLKWIEANSPETSARVWQRNYEHVIRDEAELLRVREYIRFNPMKWDSDSENPERLPDAQHDRDWAWLEGS